MAERRRAKADLLTFADAVRDVLGLAPLYTSNPHLHGRVRQETRDLVRFYGRAAIYS